MYLIVIVLIFSTLIGCTFQRSDRITNTTSPSPHLTATNQRNEQKPAIKTAVINIEGEKTEISLKLYDEAGVFTTYFPTQDFVAKSVASAKEHQQGFTLMVTSITKRRMCKSFVQMIQLQLRN